jgi:WD40 repeat protein/tetratricopeptide (TPR) repeat protein
MATYDAFISYSHAKDKPIAAALQGVVQKLGKSWYRRRALGVFRDDTSLSATPHLWPTIERALDDCRYFILLASPEAAASKWVNKEVVHWLEHNSIDTLLIGLTYGTLRWDESASDFAAGDHHPLPPALKGKFPAEPKWIDLTAYRDGADPRDERFSELAADFAAAIRGMPKEDLLSQELRQQRRALRHAWSAAAALLILLAVAAAAAKIAVDKERFAREQEQIAQEQRAVAEKNEERARQQRDQALLAQSRFLADQARQQTASGNATGGMLLALDGLRDESGSDEISRTRPYAVEAERSLYEGLIARHELTVLQSTAIAAAAFSNNGRRVLTAGRDGIAGLWDVRSGRPLALLPAHTKFMNGAAFSANERRILTWSSDEGSARVWDARIWDARNRDARTPSPLASIELKDRPRLVELTPDGQRVVTAGFLTGQVYDAQSGAELCVLRGHKEAEEIKFGPSDLPGQLGAQIKQLNRESITGAILTSDGHRLLTIARDKTARVWDLASCRQLLLFAAHKAEVWNARISADGKRVATTSRAPPRPGEIGAASLRFNEVRVWELATGKELALVTIEAHGFHHLALSPDGSFLVTAGSSSLELWEVASGQRIATQPSRSLDQVIYSRDGSRLLVASDDGYLRLFDGKILKPIASYGKHGPGVIYTAAFSPDQTQLLSVGSEGSARIWSLGPLADGERTLIAQLPEWETPGGLGRQPGMLMHQTFSPDSKLIAASGTDRTVRVWSSATGKLVRELRENGQNALVTFSPDGRRLATSGGERFVKIWDVATGREALRLESKSGNFVRLAFHPNGRMIAAGMADSSITIWDALRGVQVTVLRGHKDRVYSMSFSPNGEEILTSAFDGTIRIWNQRGERTTLKGHDGYIYETAYSPDGKYIVSRGADQSFRIWDAAGAKELAAVKHRNTSLGDRFDIANAFVISGDSGYLAMLFGTDVVIWSLAELKEVALLRAPLPMSFRAVAFGADASRLIMHSASFNANAIQFWDWKLQQFVSAAAGPPVLSGLSGLLPSPDRKLLAVLGNQGTSIQLLPIFASTQALLDHGKATVPRCLTGADQEESFARGSLGQWCFERVIWPATRGRLGVNMSSLTDEIAAALGSAKTAAVIVTTVQAAGAAEAAGIKPGDVILAIDGAPAGDPANVAQLIARTAAGQEIALTIWRKGEKSDIKARPRDILLTPDERRAEVMAPIATGLPEQAPPAQIIAALAAAERARDVLDDLLADDPGNGGLRHDLAGVYDRIATAHRLTRNADEFVAAQRQALALRQQLADDNPGDGERQRELAANHEAIAVALTALQRRDEALGTFAKALEIRRRLANEQKDNAQRQEELAVVLERTGDLLRAGWRAEALARYEEARILRETLTAGGTGDDGKRQRELVSVLNKLGDLLAEEKRNVEALAIYRKALALRLALAEAAPDNAQRKWDVSVNQFAIGDLLAREKHYDEALASLRECLAIREPLAAAQPNNVAWQRGLAAVHGKLGDVLKAQKQLTEAIAAYRKAVELREKIARGEPENLTYRRDLSLAFDDLADALEDDGKLEQSLEAFRKSLAIGRTLVGREPDNRQWAREVAVTLRNIGRVLTTLRKLSDALIAYRESLAIVSRLIDRYGGTAQWQGDRQRAITGIGGLAYYMVLSGSFAPALAAADEAIKLAPDQTWLYTNRAHALMLLGRTEEARAVYLAHRGKPKVQGDK